MIGLERLEGEVANISCRLKEVEELMREKNSELAEMNRLLRDIARSVRTAPAKRKSWFFAARTQEA